MLFYLSILKCMMGGAWFDQYIGNKNPNEVLNIAFDEIKKHLGIRIEPDYYDVAILKVIFIIFHI